MPVEPMRLQSHRALFAEDHLTQGSYQARTATTIDGRALDKARSVTLIPRRIVNELSGSPTSMSLRSGVIPT